MTGTINKDNLFMAVRSKAGAQVDSTTRNVRAIVEAEAKQREAKTAKLRQARLARDARETASRAR
jgi:hypothetical protein